MYFADPYCAWQKGTNENFKWIYPKEIQNVLNLLNNRPRKCINYKTIQELFNEYLCECCT